MWGKTRKITRADRPCTEFTIRVVMEDHWIPHFLSMLKYMEQLGKSGCSRRVSVFADGDGDFHPTFEWDDVLSDDVAPATEHDGNRLYDAG